MSIFIYTDEGVSQDSINALLRYFSDKKVVCMSGAELQKNNWVDQATLFILPGGRSLPFYQQLGAEGNKNITTFVERGGYYLGLCAGAYYASQETIFAAQSPLALHLPGELNFFRGRAIGPVFAEKAFAYGSERGACIVDLIWQDQQHYAAYFNGGCYFEYAEQCPKTLVLARYHETQQAAIIACSYGKGRAILSGVHPEFFDATDDDNRKNLFARLLTWEY